MFLRIIGLLALLVGGGISALAWGTYQFNVISAGLASAVQMSQLANQASVDILGGIGLMIFGLTLLVIALLGEIKDSLHNALSRPSSS